jgi:hypothetical protein
MDILLLHGAWVGRYDLCVQGVNRVTRLLIVWSQHMRDSIVRLPGVECPFLL